MCLRIRIPSSLVRFEPLVLTMWSKWLLSKFLLVDTFLKTIGPGSTVIYRVPLPLDAAECTVPLPLKLWQVS